MSFSKVISIIITLIIVSASKGIFKNKRRIKPSVRELDSEEMDDEMTTIMPSQSIRPGAFKEAHDLWKQGSPREALEVLNNAGKYDLNSCILLGELYYELKDYDAAIMAYKKSIRASGTSFAYSRLGEIYEAMELYSDGIKAYNSALKYPDAQKGYLYHKLGNLYMYAGYESKSEKYIEKAEMYHSDNVGTRIQSYDFQKNVKGRSRNGTYFAVLIFVLVTAVLSSAFIPFVLNVQSTTSYVEEVAVEEIVVSEMDEVVIDVTEDSEIEVFEERFGNTNSNINYGGHIAEYNGYTYLYEDNGIQKINEEDGTREFIVETPPVAYINVLGYKLFYISYDATNPTINYINLITNSSAEYSTYDPWNLLVDNQNMYFIEGIENQYLRVESHIGDQSIELPLNGILYVNQTVDSLYLLRDGIIYKVLKDNLKNNLEIITKSHAFYTDNVSFMTIEDEYIFFTKYHDMNLYRMPIEGGMTEIVLENFDIETMTLNAYNRELFIGIEADEAYTDIYDFNGVYMGTVDGTVGNQLSNDYLYWYTE